MSFRGDQRGNLFRCKDNANITEISYVSELQNIHFPLPSFAQNAFCLYGDNPQFETYHFFANITTPPPLVDYTNTPVHQLYHFRAKDFDFTVFSLLTYQFKMDGSDSSDLESGDRECVLFLDAQHWFSSCTCPLDIISNAVAIASVLILIVTPLRFYRIYQGRLEDRSPHQLDLFDSTKAI
jgi:hypothetical protein